MCSLASCQTQLPDFHGCTELSIEKGFCVTAISAVEQEVTDTEYLKDGSGKVIKDEKGFAWSWWKMRPFMIQIPYFEYVELRKWITKMCKTNPTACSSAVPSWDRTAKASEVLANKVQTK